MAADLERLKHFHIFINELRDMDNEALLQEYMKLEAKHFKRAYVMRRLYGRFNALRTRRELREIEEKYARG